MHDDQITDAEAAHAYRLKEATELLLEAGCVQTASGDWLLPPADEVAAHAVLE